MALPSNVKKYLDKHGVDYEALAHKTVYTAYDAAQTLQKQLKEIAKTILVEADKTHVLVILPADKKINMDKLKKALGAKSLRIPDEKVMIKVMKIQPGTLSSFGKLHNMETVIDKAMLGTKKAVISTGSFTDSVFMKVKDLVRMEEARLADIAMSGGYKVPKKMRKDMKKVKRLVGAKGAKRGKILPKKAVLKGPSKAKKPLLAKKAPKRPKSAKKTAAKPAKKPLKKIAKKAKR